MNDLIETFKINNRLNLSLLAAIEETYLKDESPAKGRNVGEHLAHIHNVRMTWLKEAAPELVKGLVKIDTLEMKATRMLLKEELTKSSRAIEKMLKKCFVAGEVTGFKPSPAAFVGYLITHESYHRGQVMLLLRQCGHNIGIRMRFGIHNVEPGEQED